MRIILVRQGGKYGPEYVTNLKRQIYAHESLVGSVITLDDTELCTNLKGWWAKLELFAPWNARYRPALYLDLDTIVHGRLFRYKSRCFTMVEDFMDRCPANSSVMWLPKDTSHIWDAFQEDPEGIMDRCRRGGDQLFLSDFCEKKWKTPDDGIVSFKQHCSDGPAGNIIQFHGKPKPHELDGWVAKLWRADTSG